MTDPGQFEARLTAVERGLERVAADNAAAVSDAAAARHLAAARDRDLADLSGRVDAHRAAINGLGVQTAARFDRLEGRFDRLEGRFDGLAGRFDGLEGRFDRLEERVDRLEDKVDRGFAQADRNFLEMRHKFDQTAAGMQQIVELLTRDEDR